MISWLKTLVVFLLVVIAFTFAALFVNQTEVPLTFAIWQTPPLSVFWWLLIAFLTGLLFGLLNAVWVNLRHRLANRKLRQSLARAEAELERLRAVQS